jgi:hypothetical protein
MVLSPGDAPDTTFTREFSLRGGDEQNPSIWETFGITKSNTQLERLIDVLGTFTVRIHESDQPDPNPNALWCMSTEEGYQTIVKLEFIFTISDAIEQIKSSPFGKLVTWLNTNLGLNINIDTLKGDRFKSIPPILISTSSTVTYTFDDSSPPVLKASEPVWGVSVQVEILGMSLALDFSEKDTTFYLLPTKSLGNIVESIVSAVGPRDDIDRDQM